MYKYVDIHSHLNFPDYDVDREQIIVRMKEKGVATITVGTSLETSRGAVVLAEAHEHIFACIGVHPADGADNIGHCYFDEKSFEELVKNPKVVAIGECGLDHGRDGVIDEETKKNQKALFEKHIHFAVKHDKPLMLHARSSNKDIIEILKMYKKEYGEKLRGNAHFFTGTLEEAQAFYDLGFSTSFTGVVTFTHDYDEVVRNAPLDRIMSETDAPFVSPVPYRGKRNEPTYVIETVKKLAEIKGIDEEIVQKALLDNAVAKFKLVW